jgi:hypothetical protein
MARKRIKRTVCPNCGYAMGSDANYCASCGQENHTHKLPVRHFVVEWLSGMFNFDTKLLRTVRDLFWPPGLVIKEFNENKRTRYVHPLRLYLFTSVLFFLLLAWATARLEADEGPAVVVNPPEAGTNEATGLTLQLDGDQEITDSTLTALSAIPRITNEVLDSTMMAAGITPGVINRTMIRLALNMSGNSLRKEAFLQEFLSTFSKVMFVMLPLFALLMKLLYWRGRRFYTEHLVFALYFHTVLYLLFGLSLGLGSVFDGQWTDSFLLPGTVGYLLWAMHTVHQRSWLNTSWKMLLLLFAYSLLLVLGLMAAALIGSINA